MNKPIRFSKHALERAAIRGTNEAEVKEAIETGSREVAKENRIMSRLNFEFDGIWEGIHYKIKQVAPVFVEEDSELVVITVYTFYF